MIKNDQQLDVVREQLATAQSALESLRKEVLPKNEQMYGVMAESYIDMILELRGEIDAYLGISEVPETADIVIALQGDRVGLGRTSAAVVTRFIDTFRRGLQSAVDIVESVNRPETTRRRERWIEKICDLPIVGLAPGSVRILLGEPESQGLFKVEEQQSFTRAVELIFDGLSWADVSSNDSPDHPFTNLSNETRQAMLSLIMRLLPPQTGDVEQVSFQHRLAADGPQQFKSATLTRKSRDRIRSELESLASDKEYKELEGVIRSVDLDAQNFVLRERLDGEPDLPCEYGPELEDAVKEFLDSRVMVSGSIETSRKTKKSKMAADSIELVASDDEAERLTFNK